MQHVTQIKRLIKRVNKNKPGLGFLLVFENSVVEPELEQEEP
jgi:hypothetical protein